jgi:hypothetical protein
VIAGDELAVTSKHIDKRTNCLERRVKGLLELENEAIVEMFFTQPGIDGLFLLLVSCNPGTGRLDKAKTT